MEKEWISKLPTFGIGGKSLLTAIVILATLWTIRECFRYKYGRDSSTHTLLEYSVSLLKTLWGEKNSKDPVQRTNFRLVILLILVFVVFAVLFFLSPKLLPDSLVDTAGCVLLAIPIITIFTAIGSAIFVMKLQVRRDLGIDD